MRPLKNSVSMQDANRFATLPVRAEKAANDHGVALVITLLLLFLLSIIGLAAVLSTSSDLLINGYYSNSRASFYAAESGVNIARQTLENTLNVGTPSCAACTCGSAGPPAVAAVGPLAANFGSSTMSGIVAQYQNNTPLTGANAANPGEGLSSWSESFKLINTATHPTSIALAANSPTPSCQGPVVNGANTPNQFVYNYLYTISAVGSATGNEQSTVTESGSIVVNIPITAGVNENAAYYGAFITNYAQCLGALVPGTMTGPMFTDGSWGFETGGQYIFTDAVGQVNPTASFFDSRGCNQSATSPFVDPHTHEVVAPTFQGGFQVNQPKINQPADSFSQMWAAVDGLGQGEADPSPTQNDLSGALKTVGGASYPSTATGPPPSTGVFLNYNTSTNPPTMQGGGLYIQGNASIELSPSGASAQVYTITQGTGPSTTVTTMTVDPVANTTVVTSQVGSAAPTTLSLSGVPMDKASNPPQQGTMVYVNGAITGMTGPGEGMGAIQNGANVTITAAGDVNLTGDIRYVTEPVTTAPNQIPGTPPATLIPGNDHNQDLGIFTANGNIIMSSPYHDDNLEVDGSQAALGGSCASNSCGFLVNGCINTFNNVGGQLQTNIFGACLNVENTYYDRRYNTKPNFAPPWFPGLTITGTLAVGPTVTTLQRTSWLSSSGQ
jgi:Tfp pilus assembly protein PilX